MKLCKDCAYYRAPLNPRTCVATCSHPDAVSVIEPVEGRKVHKTCAEMRINSTATPRCGHSAEWFKAIDNV